MATLVSVLQAGFLYFIAVFGAGFALGTLRVLWLAPLVGARAAELIEMPLMLAIMVLAARFFVRKLRLPPQPAARLAMGALALVLVLAAEFTLMLRLRGLSFAEYFATLDLVTASLYYTLLAVFGVLPLLVPPTGGLKRRYRAAALLAALVVAIPAGLVYESYRRDIALERMRVDIGGRTVETPCGRIEFASVGAGPAVLLVHGAGGGYDQVLDMASELAAGGFQVVTMSRFGYLGTPLPADPSPAAQADAHACLLDALKIERTAIIGISAGAPSTLQFALRHPQRTSALVLLVPLAFRPDAPPAAARPSAPARFMFERALKSDFLYWVATEIAPSLVVRTILATPPAELAAAGSQERARVRQLMERIEPLSRRQQGLLNDVSVAQTLQRYELERIAAPTVVISLADDLYGTYETAGYTAANIKGARFIGYATGGHVWAGHHAEIVAEVSRFIGRHAGSQKKENG